MRRTNGLVCAGVFGLVRACGMGMSSVIAIGAGTLVLSGVASADVKSVEPHMMIVTKDGAALRCDTGNIYYPVRVLKVGDLIKVDGEGSGWVRAEYPAGTRAYIRADEATFDSASKTVKLTKASKLMAANDTGARPWWPLMDKDIAAGTTYSPAEMMRAADGTTEGYLFPAPTGAHGYIKAEQVRNATPEEIAGKSATPSAPVAVTPKPAETKPAEVKVAETKPAEIKPADAKPTETKPAEITMKPAEVKPVETKPVEPAPQPVAVKPATPPTPAAQPTQEIVEVKPAEVRMTTPRVAAAAPRPQVTRRIDDVSVLRDMFERAMQPESDGAEITTVISEFNRTIDSLATSGDEGKIRAALEQRLEALRMRQEVAEASRKLHDTGQIDERLRQVKLAVESAQKQAIYAIVGRMLPSTVYDGKRGMPLMYRVESADFSSTRTIGYVIPSEGMDLLPVMGKIVGIVGDVKMDPALGLNLVIPVRVDEMRVTGGKLEVVPGAVSMPTAPATPGSAAPAGSTGAPAPKSKPETEPKGEPVASPTTDTGEINK